MAILWMASLATRRIFVGFELGEVAQADAEQLVRSLGGQGDRSVHWVRVADMHVTLAFLGSVKDSVVAEVCSIAREVSKRMPRFRWRLRGVGGFPSLSRVRVLWAGVEETSGALASLREELELALTTVGYRPEERAFRPHMTLGRVGRRSAIGGDLLSLLERHRSWSGREVELREIVVFASESRPNGARYPVLARCPLMRREGSNGA